MKTEPILAVVKSKPGLFRHEYEALLGLHKNDLRRTFHELSYKNRIEARNASGGYIWFIAGEAPDLIYDRKAGSDTHYSDAFCPLLEAWNIRAHPVGNGRVVKFGLDKDRLKKPPVKRESERSAGELLNRLLALVNGA